MSRKLRHRSEAESLGAFEGGATGGVLGGIIGGTAVPPPIAPPAPEKKTKEILRPGGDVKLPQKIYAPAPIYPALAKAAHIQGEVLIDAVIDEHGNIVNAQVVRRPSASGAGGAANGNALEIRAHLSQRRSPYR